MNNVDLYFHDVNKHSEVRMRINIFSLLIKFRFFFPLLTVNISLFYVVCR